INPDSVEKNDPNDVQLQDEDIMYDIASSVELNLDLICKDKRKQKRPKTDKKRKRQDKSEE
ncbi:hypothetical protein Tco_0220887, partial [Tanacetum coccineum]